MPRIRELTQRQDWGDFPILVKYALWPGSPGDLTNPPEQEEIEITSIAPVINPNLELLSLIEELDALDPIIQKIWDDVGDDTLPEEPERPDPALED